jgi:hypothetical protein
MASLSPVRENADMSDLPPLQLPRTKGRSIFQIVGSIGFVLVGLLMVIGCLGSQPFEMVPFVIGLLAVVVFGFFGFLSVRMLLRPALVIDDHGIWDNTSGLSVGFIPWEQTLGFQPAKVLFNDFVAVFWADEQWAWAHMGSTTRLMNRLNRSMTPVGPISADFLKMTGSQLALMLLAQRRQRRPELPEVPGMPATAS